MEKPYYDIELFNGRKKNIPRAKGLPFIGQTLDVVLDPLQLLLRLKKSEEELVKLKFGLKDYVLVQSPAGARYVLQENARNFYKPGAARLMKKILGDGVATSNEDLWLKQRRLIQPIFHKQKLNDFLLIIQKETEELIKNWKQRPGWSEVDISKDFLKLTLNNITKAMFGLDVESKMDEIADVLKTMQDFSSEATKTLFKIPLGIPTKKNVEFRKAQHRFEKIIYEIINSRKNAVLPEKNDLLQLLLSAYDDQSKAFMTEKQLRDEITTIFMAGHETTSQTLSWIFYQLALHPGIFQKVKKEATEFDLNSFEELQNLVYTKSVIDEALRFYPPVWIIARKSATADTINGYELPPGSTVLINVYGLHHSENHWINVKEFNPSRFLEEEKKLIPPFSYLPFGGGQRLCIGHHFAMMVMQTVVAGLVATFEFRVPPGFIPKVDPNITLRAKDGIQLLIKAN